MVEFVVLDNITNIEKMKRAYLVSLVAPLDVYWQAAIIDPAPHWEMVADGRSLGYFAADEKKRL
ncbi:MAG: hypothetical protein GY803_21860, partial [Chloroflexi bacterium]|nr:hypothetical protein [Chloroflexota bacterium]